MAKPYGSDFQTSPALRERIDTALAERDFGYVDIPCERPAC